MISLFTVSSSTWRENRWLYEKQSTASYSCSVPAVQSSQHLVWSHKPYEYPFSHKIASRRTFVELQLEDEQECDDVRRGSAMQSLTSAFTQVQCNATFLQIVKELEAKRWWICALPIDATIIYFNQKFHTDRIDIIERWAFQDDEFIHGSVTLLTDRVFSTRNNRWLSQFQPNQFIKFSFEKRRIACVKRLVETKNFHFWMLQCLGGATGRSFSPLSHHWPTENNQYSWRYPCFQFDPKWRIVAFLNEDESNFFSFLSFHFHSLLSSNRIDDKRCTNSNIQTNVNVEENDRSEGHCPK